jgi:hypothetical protein
MRAGERGRWILAASFLWLILPTVSVAQQIAGGYPLPGTFGRRTRVFWDYRRAGPDGALWFTESYANKVGRIHNFRRNH